MSATLNQHQLGALPSNTHQNLINDSHCLFITTQSGKDTIDPPINVIDNMRNDP